MTLANAIAFATAHALAAAKADADATFAPTAPAARAPSAEVVTRQSTIGNPVAAALAFFAAHPDLRRSEAIRGAEALGVATNTARTQYQRWFKAQGR